MSDPLLAGANQSIRTSLLSIGTCLSEVVCGLTYLGMIGNMIHDNGGASDKNITQHMYQT